MAASVGVSRFEVIALFMGFALFGGGSLSAAQTTVLEPGDSRWRFAGEARPTTYEGEEVLYLRRGNAVRPDVRFADGTIEFDMLPTDRRTFLGIVFRVPEEGHTEDIYLRLHKSKHPDAVQYSPDYGGRGQWQLYHGPSATAAATYAPGEWQHVRIEVRGEQAAVFVGKDTAEPNLVVDRLRTGAAEGFVGFWGNFPGAGEDDPPTALLRNITVRRGTTSYGFAPSRPEVEEPGVVDAWSLSRPFVRSDAVIRELPREALAGGWRTVGSEPSGLLPFDRHAERPEGGTAAVLAGFRLRSEGERVVPIDLGFSDDASVFLNGRLVYSGKYGYSHNFPRRQGLITLDQATLYLPLRDGANDLVVAVSEIFGGWGVMARIADREGLSLEPLR